MLGLIYFSFQGLLTPAFSSIRRAAKTNREPSLRYICWKLEHIKNIVFGIHPPKNRKGNINKCVCEMIVGFFFAIFQFLSLKKDSSAAFWQSKFCSVHCLDNVICIFLSSASLREAQITIHQNGTKGRHAGRVCKFFFSCQQHRPTFVYSQKPSMKSLYPRMTDEEESQKQS